MNVGIITASDKGVSGRAGRSQRSQNSEIIEAQGYTVRKKVILAG